MGIWLKDRYEGKKGREAVTGWSGVLWVLREERIE